jgi:hypothetical protein
VHVNFTVCNLTFIHRRFITACHSCSGCHLCASLLQVVVAGLGQRAELLQVHCFLAAAQQLVEQLAGIYSLTSYSSCIQGGFNASSGSSAGCEGLVRSLTMGDVACVVEAVSLAPPHLVSEEWPAALDALLVRRLQAARVSRHLWMDRWMQVRVGGLDIRVTLVTWGCHPPTAPNRCSCSSGDGL